MWVERARGSLRYAGSGYVLSREKDADRLDPVVSNAVLGWGFHIGDILDRLRPLEQICTVYAFCINHVTPSIRSSLSRHSCIRFPYSRLGVVGLLSVARTDIGRSLGPVMKL